jgi:uncharacterized repeat protein (TIGR01451 family)
MQQAKDLRKPPHLPSLSGVALCFFSLLLTFAGSAYGADVLISMFDDNPDPVARGGEVTYTINVENQQADIATDVELSFPLPVNTVFVSLDNGSCSHDGGTPGVVTCTYGDMLGTAAIPPGPIETVNVVIQANGSTYDATATVSMDPPGYLYENKTCFVAAEIYSPTYNSVIHFLQYFLSRRIWSEKSGIDNQFPHRIYLKN